jgi:hypothetical protein
MLKADIKPGAEYALREKRVIGAALERVRILAHIRGKKWKAEWVEPNLGLVHFVESAQLVSTWRDHKAFLKQEAQEARLKEQNVRDGYGKDSPVDRAIYDVFESVADDLQYYNGVLSGSPEAMARVKTRGGLDVNKRSPAGYVDRAGRLHLPFGDAVDLARAFCAAEPSAVLVNVEATERKWSREFSTPGEEHRVGLLNELRARMVQEKPRAVLN